MAESLKVLRRRVRSVKNVRQITRAMEMVSAAKLRRTLGTLNAARPFARKLQEILGRLAGSASMGDHPLFQERPGKRTTIVLFTADRGLCGSFNVNMINKAERFAKEIGKDNVQLYTVGKKGLEHFRKRGWKIAGTMTDMGGKVDSERSNQLADDLLRMFLNGETDSIYLVYSHYRSASSYVPTIEKFLNLDPESLLGEAAEAAAKGPQTEYILEPSAETVFNELLPRYLKSKIFITFAETMTSEHSARMLAMHNASKNCEDLRDTLTLRLNKARQASITKELLDIVGGAEALKG